MTTFDLTIVGGGLASARAIKAYREAEGRGRIALLSRDDTLPYHRPPLSKRFLRGETDEPALVEDERFYTDLDVEVVLGAEATAVDPRERVVVAGGRPYGYRQLLLATGARPRRLPIPGADLGGVFNLRTFRDAESIRAAAESAERAVVVGGGFIGMEVAASLRTRGLDVTLVHLGRWLFDQLGVEDLSDDLAAIYRERGVELVLGHQVDAFAGGSSLEAVVTADGRRIDADLAVVGVGVEPVTDFLAGSGIAVDDGVVVDERFESNVDGVFAVGDVARFYDPLFRRHRRIEHWSNASYQGTEVGRILAGAPGRYDTVSSFFSEVFDVTIKVFGDARPDAEVVVHGSLRDGDLYALYGVDGEVVGALSVGQAESVEEALRDLVAERSALGEAQLAA